MAHNLLKVLLENISELENCNCKLCISLNKIKEIANNDFHEVNEKDLEENIEEKGLIFTNKLKEEDLEKDLEKDLEEDICKILQCGSGIILKGRDTIKIKEYLKKYKCSWNPNLGGWITFNDNKNNLKKLLNHKKINYEDLTSN